MGKNAALGSRSRRTPSPLLLDEWERGWQSFWKEAGFTPESIHESLREF